MADLLVRPAFFPTTNLKSLLQTPTHRHDAKATSIPCSKSSIELRNDAGLVTGALARTLRGANNLLLSWKDGLTPEQRHEQRMHDERRQILCLRMKSAEKHEQWEAAAKELDSLEGNDQWKHDATSNDYNPELIAQRLQELDDARASCDIDLMMYLIRTALSRDLGGMDNVDLYRHSYIGTKRLIESYVESTIATIDAVVTHSRYDPSVEHRDLLEGMLYARQSFGRSALLLSGGGTFGMAHVGVLKSLFHAKLLPRIISGASAGSIVCAVMCTRTDEEMPALMEEFPYGDLAVFEGEEDRDSVLEHLRRLLTEGSWSDIKHLTRVMRGLTGDLTFQEAYNRTRRILNICVSTASMYELPRLLNYVTAPNVMIWSAVAASCSVPLMFTSAQILVKDPVTGDHMPWNPSPQKWIDGSVDNDLPMTRLSEMFNVNHFIVSQVNPHVVPFLSKDDHLSPDGKPDRPKVSQGDEIDWIDTIATLAKDEALHRLQFLAEMGILPNVVTKFRSILSQRYSGDITILPEMSLQDLPRLLKNPTSEFMLRVALAGERATWPKLSRIRDRCAIELALDNAVHRLRARVVFSESQQDLRKLRYSYGNLRSYQPSIDPPVSSCQEYQRHRRRSGGSTTLLPPQSKRTFFTTVMKDRTAEEEYLELKSGYTSVSSPLAFDKPKLKRASRSQLSVLQQRRPFTAPAGDPGPTFTRPLYSRSGSKRGQVSNDEAPNGTQPWSLVDSWGTDDMDTSEQGPDESDLELLEHSRTSPETQALKTEDDIVIGGSSDDMSEGLWN